MGNKQATREAYGKVLVELGKENPNLIVVDADLSLHIRMLGYKMIVGG